MERFVIGLSKKVLISNPLGQFVGIFQASAEKSVLFFWLYAFSYGLQVYFDFSGYSDMAIGLGRIFGFEFSENFQYPFISGSITEFWRRWHISSAAGSGITSIFRSAAAGFQNRGGISIFLSYGF